jgi:hypothetical protein
MDSNGDGTVSPAERSAYLAQQAQDVVQTLFKAVASDGGQQISASEVGSFTRRLAAAGGRGSADAAAQAPATDHRAMAEQLLRRYGEALAANSSTGSSLSVAA